MSRRRSLTREIMRSELLLTTPPSVQGDLLILARNPALRMHVLDLKHVKKCLLRRRSRRERHLAAAEDARPVRRQKWTQRVPRYYCLLCYYAVAAVVSASVAFATCFIAAASSGGCCFTIVGDLKCTARKMRDLPGATMQKIFSQDECVFLCNNADHAWVGNRSLRCKFDEESGVCIGGYSHCAHHEYLQFNVTDADDEGDGASAETIVKTNRDSKTTPVIRRLRRRRQRGAPVETKTVLCDDKDN
ncbi:hypothetical protein MTO96_002701 [Rhipicephalus appendiculatus]